MLVGVALAPAIGESLAEHFPSMKEWIKERSGVIRVRASVSSQGFTLIEMLVVISIAAILATLTASAIAGLNKADKFNSAVNNLSATLGLARQTAVAHNTYVWVAFAIPATSIDPLQTLVLASNDGTNPLATGWPSVGSAPIALPDPHYLVVGKQARYAQCQLLDSGALTTTQIPALPHPLGASVNALGSGLSFTIGSPAGTITYTRVIEYAPTGLAYNGPNPVAFIEFGVQPAPVPSASATTPNVACFRIPFITGQASLYRP